MSKILLQFMLFSTFVNKFENWKHHPDQGNYVFVNEREIKITKQLLLSITFVNQCNEIIT